MDTQDIYTSTWHTWGGMSKIFSYRLGDAPLEIVVATMGAPRGDDVGATGCMHGQGLHMCIYIALHRNGAQTEKASPPLHKAPSPGPLSGLAPRPSPWTRPAGPGQSGGDRDKGGFCRNAKGSGGLLIPGPGVTAKSQRKGLEKKPDYGLDRI